MYKTDHGGGCCGIQHVQEFGLVATAEAKKLLSSFMLKCRYAGKSYLVEVALNEQQVPSWEPVLLNDFDFVKVTTFKNPGSGRFVTLYVYTDEIKAEKEAAKEEKALAEKAEAERLAAEKELLARAQAEAITEVLSTAPRPRKRLLKTDAVKPAKKKRIA